MITGRCSLGIKPSVKAATFITHHLRTGDMLARTALSLLHVACLRFGLSLLSCQYSSSPGVLFQTLLNLSGDLTQQFLCRTACKWLTLVETWQGCQQRSSAWQAPVPSYSVRSVQICSYARVSLDPYRYWGPPPLAFHQAFCQNAGIEHPAFILVFVHGMR